VLRILDSKDSYDQQVVQNAPLFSEFLNESSKARFQQVTKGLEAIGEFSMKFP
jgi:histidyl-tRNA synthetase